MPATPDLQMILEHINDLKNQMESIQNHFDDSMNAHETVVKDHFSMCNRLCMTKIENIEATSNKAHERLDKHRDKFIDLCGWKHQMTGRMWVIPFIVTPVVSGAVALIVFLITKQFGGT